MSQTMFLGSTVQCTDGKGGSVQGLVCDPSSNRLEYLVVHRGLFGGHNHTVPASVVQTATPLAVLLTLNTDELKQLSDVEAKVPGTGIVQRSIPDHCVILSADTPITDADGTLIGRFQGVVVDSMHQITSILPTDAGPTEIPIEQLTACSETGLTVQRT